MKNILSIIIFLFLIFACSSNDESTDNSISITGKWQIISYEDNATALTGCDALGQREFKTGGNLTETYFSGNDCQTTSINSSWNYTISDGKLFTTEPNGGNNANQDYIINYNIIQLSETNLKLELYFIDEGVDGFTAEDIPVNERSIETWEKID